MLEPAGPVGGTRGLRPLRARLALSLLAVATTAACGTAAGAEEDADRGGSAPAAAGSATTVQDGALTVTVSDVDCSQQTLGTTAADGVFCLVPVTMTNDSDAPQAIDVTIQRARDADGNEYSGVGGIGASVPEAAFPAELAPGEEAAGSLVFDVPEGTDLTELEVNDSPYSSGETVDLP